MSEVSDVAIKRTQDSLGKLIKKPVLTDKLLRKPPFKFLHDIIRAVINTTGFFDGLYTEEELQSDNIKDRDSKIAFLQKAIDALRLATKQEVRARPSKIVSGLESDKTNELLLAIARAIDRKIDSTEAVALVKSGNVNLPQKKEPKPTKTQTKTDSRKTSKLTKEPTTAKKIQNNVSSDKKPQKDNDNKAKVTKQSSKDSSDSKKLKTKSQAGDKAKDSKKDREKKHSQKEEVAREVAREVAKDVAQPENDQPNTDMTQINGNAHVVIENGERKPNSAKIEPIETIEQHNNLPKDDRPEKPMEIEQQLEKLGKTEQMETPERNEKKSSASPKKQSAGKAKKIEVENQTPKSAASVEQLVQEINEPPPPSSGRAVQENSSEKPRSSKSKKSHSRSDHEKPSENASNGRSDDRLKTSKSIDKITERSGVAASKAPEDSKHSKPPRTALRSAAVRPISARPSAPRRRDRNVRQILHTESFVQDTTDQSKADKKNSMPEFDDADNIVITDTIPDNIPSVDDIDNNKMENGEIDGKQGHLVQQILETQTAILKSDTKNDVAINDESILSDRKSITRNMAELRKIIQKLSLYISPLGKMMEYFQEDVDAMQIELLMWQKAGTAAEADIKEEQRKTEKLLENFKYQLAEINNGIKDHAEQINNTTMNIIQNEEKISKLIGTL